MLWQLLGQLADLCHRIDVALARGDAAPLAGVWPLDALDVLASAGFGLVTVENADAFALLDVMPGWRVEDDAREQARAAGEAARERWDPPWPEGATFDADGALQPEDVLADPNLVFDALPNSVEPGYVLSHGSQQGRIWRRWRS